MTLTFRKDTSFPYLRIAREAGVPYSKVLRIADAYENGDDVGDLDDPLLAIVVKAVNSEWARRRDVKGVA